VDVERIFRVEGDGRRSSLGARPEWLSVLVLVVFREDMQEVSNLVVEE
jgi:hypothetical protein